MPKAFSLTVGGGRGQTRRGCRAAMSFRWVSRWRGFDFVHVCGSLSSLFVDDEKDPFCVPGQFERWNLACEKLVLHKLTGTRGSCSVGHLDSNFLSPQLSVVPCQLTVLGTFKKDGLWDHELFSCHQNGDCRPPTACSSGPVLFHCQIY